MNNSNISIVPNTVQQQPELRMYELRDISLDILKTIEQMERNYSADYLIRVLQGFDKFGLKNEKHRSLDTFGSLHKIWYERMVNIIKWLTRMDFIQVANPTYGTLKLSEKGRAFLAQPEDLIAPLKELRTSEKDRLMAFQLRALRSELASKKEMMAYMVFNNYCLQNLVSQQPGNVTDLKNIAGLSDSQVDQFGHLILQTIKQVKLKSQILLAKMKAQYPGHQEVKALWEAGKKVEEIAEMRSVKPATILRQLEQLHLAGEVDMSDWIEESIDSKDFHQATEYFKQVENPKLKEAYEVTGLDYETLRLCRLFVSKVSSEEVVLPMVG